MNCNDEAAVLTRDLVLKKRWRFFHRNGPFACSDLRFEEDGSISGYDHPNERCWLLTRSTLIVLDERGTPTAIFDDVRVVDGFVTMMGKHIPDPSIHLCLQEAGGSLLRPHPTREAFKRAIDHKGWRIGRHTYGVPTILDGADGVLEVGNYTSISGAAVFCLSNHRMDSVTTYPFRVLSQHWPTVESSCFDHVSKGATVVGSDVWIGHHAFIGSGVTIGHGAVIGAGATVTKDVPPFAVCVGNPGRVVRHRFDPRTVDRLLRIRWWDLDDAAVEALIPSMFKADFSDFFALAAAARGEVDGVDDLQKVAARMHSHLTRDDAMEDDTMEGVRMAS